MTIQTFWDTMDINIKFMLIALGVSILWYIDRRIRTKGDLVAEVEKNKVNSDKNDTETRSYILELAARSDKRIDELSSEVISLRKEILDISREKAFTSGQYDQVTKTLDTANNENTLLREKVAKLEKQIAELQAKVATLEGVKNTAVVTDTHTISAVY